MPSKFEREAQIPHPPSSTSVLTALAESPLEILIRGIFDESSRGYRLITESHCGLSQSQFGPRFKKIKSQEVRVVGAAPVVGENRGEGRGDRALPRSRSGG
ncbi:hypothetical protein KM043_005697 [Ampulex compressa]|nr:hypothetical protein KM043_005697 [Ampulex compressa]